MFTPPSDRPVSKNVQLMATCLCDALFPEAAKASVEVLEYAGCKVEFPVNQTCCGQPAFNAGDWPASRRVINHSVQVFSGDRPVIVPSGSCAAMVFHGANLAFENEPEEVRKKVSAMGGRSWEICDYLVNGLTIRKWPGKFNARLAVHHSCHTRGSGTGPAMVQLLESIDGVELVTFQEDEQCCGFGGTFSVSFPHISARMGKMKIEHVLQVKPDLIVSADMSCLMHQQGLADKAGLHYPIRHVTEILAEALRNSTEGGQS